MFISKKHPAHVHPFPRHLAFLFFPVYSVTIMNALDIKTIEDLSLNAWPSWQMQLYDGWILRFSHMYTYRTNCVEQFGSPELPLDEKIAYCEEIYKRWKSPCVFKITPLNTELDPLLDNQGYMIRNKTHVMCLDLDRTASNTMKENGKQHFSTIREGNMTVRDRIPDEWIDALFAIKGNATVTHLKIVPSMYAAIPKDVRCAYIRHDEQIVATGLGILDREYVGIYAINVDASCRRKGLAEKICNTLLTEGKKAGAKKAYLQVLEGNAPAIHLYEKLGFTRQYSYWFRFKEL